MRNFDPDEGPKSHRLSPQEIELETALDPLTSGGRLTASVRQARGTGVWLPTQVEVGQPLDQGRTSERVLRWSEEERRMQEAKDGCLAAFLKLGQGEAEAAILRFARKWGVLGLRPKLTLIDPYEDRHTRFSYERPRDWLGPEDIGWFDWDKWYEEPLSLWHTLSRKMDAVIRVAKAAHEGQAAGRDPISVLGVCATLWGTMQKEYGGVQAAQQALVTKTLAEWLGWVRIAPTVDWLVPTGKDRARPGRLAVAFRAEVPASELRNWDDGWITRNKLEQMAKEREPLPEVYAPVPGPRPSTLWGLLMIELMTALTSPGDWYQCGLCLSMFPNATGRRLRSDATPVCEGCRKLHRQRIQAESYARRRGRGQQQE